MRKDQWDTTVTIDGVAYGTFDQSTGGEADTDELKYKPGGMAAQISLGGIVTVGALTVSRLYVLERDHVNVHNLLGRVGKAQVVVKKQPLDVDGNAFGRPLTYNGVLKRVTPPEVDSESTDAALIEIEVTPSGTIT